MVNYKDHRGGYKWHEGYFDLYRSPKIKRLSFRQIIFVTSTMALVLPLNQLLKHLINSLPYWENRVTFT
jgi:hypothetical protein